MNGLQTPAGYDAVAGVRALLGALLTDGNQNFLQSVPENGFS